MWTRSKGRKSEKLNKHTRKNDKGSITLFVLIGMLFFTVVSVNVYTSNSNKIQSQQKELSKTQQEYQVTDEEIEEKYEDVVNDETSEMQIVLSKVSDGSRYVEGTWSNESLSLTVIYPNGVADEDRYVYINDVKEAYQEGKVIDQSSQIHANALGRKATMTAKIDKTAPVITIAQNGGIYGIHAGETVKVVTSAKIEDLGPEKGVSGAKEGLEYVWTTTAEAPTEGWTGVTNQQDIVKEVTDPGVYYLWVKGSDEAGNQTQVVSKPFIIKEEVSLITITPSTKEFINQDITAKIIYEDGLQNKKAGVAKTLQAAKDNKQDKTNYTETVTITENGFVYAEAKDTAKKLITKELEINNIDKIPPTVTITPNGGANYVMPTVGKAKIQAVLQAQDQGVSGLNTLQYAWSTSNSTEPTTWTNFTNGQTVTKTDCEVGNYYLWTKVTDKAGNRAVTTKVSNAFTVIHSEITLIAQPTIWTNTDVTVRVTYGNKLTENQKAGFETNLVAKATTVTVTKNGTVYAEATDIVGNKVTANLAITNIDKTLPTVTLNPNGGTKYTMPTSGNNATIKTILTAADQGGSGLNTLQYAWSTSNTAEPTTWTNFTSGSTISKTDCTAGNYYLWTKVTDVAGNRATNTKVSNVFTVNPNTSVGSKITLTPNTTAWTNQNVTVTVAYGEYLTQNKKAGVGSASTANATTVTVTANGTVYAEATDIAGNKVTANLTVGNIDKILPTVTLNPNGGTKYIMPTSGNATIKTTLTAADQGGSELNTLQYAWSTSNTTEPTTWTNFTNGSTVSKTDCTAGNYYLWTKVTDKAGNRATNTKVSNVFTVHPNTEAGSKITLTPSTTNWTNQNVTVTVVYGEYLTQNKKAGFGSASTANATSVVVSQNGTVYAEATDLVGNKITASLAVGNIDKTLPTVSLNPNGGTKYTMPTSGNATIKTILTAADQGGSGLNTLQYAWSTSNTTEPTSWTNFTSGSTVSKTDCTAGNYYLWTKVTDKAGNRATNTKVSNVFTVNPNTAVGSKITLTPNTTDWTNQNVTVTVAYGANLTQNKKAGFGSASTANATSVVVSQNGTVYAEATDIAGNKVTASLAVGNIDKVIPVLSDITNSTNGNWTNDKITLSWTITERESGVQKVEYSGDGKTWAGELSQSEWYGLTRNNERNDKLYFRVTDKAGNVSAVKNTTMKIDKTVPATNHYAGTMLYQDPSFASGNNGINIYNNSANGTVTHTRKQMTDNPAGSNYGIEIKTAGTASPGYGGFYFATKTEANKEFITRIVAKIPVGYAIEWASNGYGTTGAKTEWLTSQAGTGNWQEYIFRVKCGSEGTFSSTNFFYLKGGTAPTESSPLVWQLGYATVIDTSKWSTSNYIVSSGTDGASGIVAYGVNQSATTQPTWTTFSAKSNVGKMSNSLTANGTYYVWMKDAAGNATNKPVTVAFIDRTAPTVSLSPNGGNYVKPTSGNATIKTTLTVADTGGSGLNTIQYAWSTSNTTEPTSWTTFTNGQTVSKTDCTEGTYYLWTKVTDVAGNRASNVKVSNGFTVNSNTIAGGKITLTPNTTAWTNQDVTVTVAYGQYLTQNKKAGVGSASTANATSVKVTANGTVYAEATDVAGNKVTANLAVGNIDKVKPATPTVTNPSNGNWSKADVTVTLSSTDNLSGIKQFEWYNGSSWVTTSLTTTGNNGTITFTVDRNTTIRFRVLDKAGNSSDEATTTMKIDKTVPTIGSAEIKNLTTTGYDVYVYGVTDSGSGINRVQFPTWTDANGQDDILPNWSTNSAATGTKQADGTTWVYHVNVTDHKNEYGKYITHVYVYDNVGNQKTASFNDIQVPGVTVTYDYQGARNYAEVMDSGKTITGFTGITNYCPGLYPLSTNGLQTGDKITLSFDMEYTNLTADTTKDYHLNPQGSGNVTSWTPGIAFSQVKLTGSGTHHYESTVTLSEEQLKNATFSLNLRSDYYTGGSIKITNFKIKRTTKKTETKGYGSPLGTLPAVSEEGYTFNGWYTAPTGGTKITTATTTPSANVTYYAQWNINQYTLTVNPGGSTYQQNYQTTKSISAPASSYTVSFNSNGGSSVASQSSSRAFLNWSLSGSGKVNSATANPVTYLYGAGNGTITANYNANGSQITLPAPTKTGYTFSGWYKESGLTTLAGAGGAKYTPTSTHTLYAKWTINQYTLTVNPGGSTYTQNYQTTKSISAPASSYTVSFNTNGGVAVSSMSSSRSFTNWSLSGSGTLSSTTTNPTTYTYGAGNGTLTANYNTTGSQITLPAPTRTGYTFSGWYKEAALTNLAGAAGAKYAPTSTQTLYAKWTINQYTLTVNPGGSTYKQNYASTKSVTAPASSYTITFNSNGGSTVNAMTPTRNFTSWSLSGSGTLSSTTTNPTTYTYGAGDGTITANYNATANAITLPAPTKTGYTFSGWYKEAGLTTLAGAGGASYSATSSQTLYAKWTINQYTLTVNPGGSTYKQNYASTKSVTAPTTSYTITFNSNGGSTVNAMTPTRNFTSWSLSGSGTLSSTTANPTTYTYGAGNGTLTANYNGTANAITLPTPTKTGYTFSGWYKEAGLTTLAGAGGASYSATTNQTLYAKWTINGYTLTVNPGGSKYTQNYNTTKSITAPASSYTVSFNSNGGSAAANMTSSRNFSSWTLSGSGKLSSTATNPTTYTYGAGNDTLTANYNGTGNAITLPSTTKAGYTFGGWYKESALTNLAGAAGASYSPTSTQTLYAKWTANSYTVSFNSNGGSTISSKTVTYDSTYGTLTSPTKTGYTFSGWYKESALTNKVASDTKVTTAGNHTLYAKWTVNQYNLTVNPNGGSWNGQTANSTVTQNYLSTKDLGTATAPAGYKVTFNGNGGTASSPSLTSTRSFSSWTKSGLGSYVGKVGNPTTGGMSMARKSDGEGEYLNYQYRVSAPAANTWYYSRFPTYTYTSGDTYEIRFKVRVNSVSGGASIIFRHSALANDYGTAGLQTKAFSSTTSGWVDVTLTRTISGTTTTLNNATVNIAPVFELYTDNLVSKTASMDFDIRDIAIVNTSKQTVLQSTNNTYLYGAGAGTVTANYTNNSITLPTATRSGYTLEGWYDAATGGNKIGNAGATYIPTVAKTLYAHWTANEYSVRAEPEGKTYTGAYMSTIPITAPSQSYQVSFITNGGSIVTTKTSNRAFKNWTLSGAGSVGSTSTNPAMYTFGVGNGTLTANYEATGEAVILPTPTKTGYTFNGWYKDSGFTTLAGAGGASYSPTSTHTLYAKWTVNNYTVRTQPDGSFYSGDYGTTKPIPAATSEYTVSFNSNGGSTVASMKANRQFKLWALSGAGSIGSPSTNPVMYTFGAGNGTLTASYETQADAIVLPSPTKTGYSFDGWYTDSTLSTIAGQGGSYYYATGDKTLYAKWTTGQYTLTVNPGGITYKQDYNTTKSVSAPASSYTVSFNSNGGSSVSSMTSSRNFSSWSLSGLGKISSTTTNPTTYTYAAGNGTLTANYSGTGNQITLPTPTKTGYTFGGWYKESALTNLAGAGGAKYAPTANQTLYAKWNINEYTLTVSPGGATYKQNYNTTKSVTAPASTYTISFNSNGGSAASNMTSTRTFSSWTLSGSGKVSSTTTNPTTYTYGAGNGTLTANYSAAGSQIILPSPTRAGYTFNGWYTDTALTTLAGTGGAKYAPTSSHTLYAKWTINGYTLTVNPGGATYSQNYNTTKSITAPASSYTIAFNANGGNAVSSMTSARTFSSWTLSGVGTISSTTANPTTYTYAAGNATLTANYSGSGKSITLPTPTRTGYAFNGWYKESSFTTLAGVGGASYTPTSSHTLYAKWTISSYTLTVNPGGSKYTQNYNTTKSITAPASSYTVSFEANGGTATSSINSSRNFSSWTKSGSGSISSTTTNPTTYTFGAGDGSLTANYNSSGNAITLPTPTRTGYTFAGWYKESSLTTLAGKGGASYTPTSSQTLYAKWTINQYTLTVNPGGATYKQDYGSTKTISAPESAYTIKFNSNGGSAISDMKSTKTFDGWMLTGAGTSTNLRTDPITFTYGAGNATLEACYLYEGNAITLPTPMKDGYTFDGWYTAATGGTLIGKAGGLYVPSSDMTLYAHWVDDAPVINQVQRQDSNVVQDGLMVQLEGNKPNAQKELITNVWEDYSDNNRDGAIKGSTGMFTTEALPLNGTTQFVNLGILNSPQQTIEITFHATAATISNTSVHNIIGNWETGGGGIYLSAGTIRGQYYINNAYVTIDSGIKPTANTKYTVSLSYDGFTLKLFVNGTLAVSKAVTGTILPPQSNTIMAIGGNAVGDKINDGWFAGNIYQVRIYNRGLTDDEIVANYGVKKVQGLLTGKAIDTGSGIIAYQFSTDAKLTASSSGWTSITNTKSEITQTKIIDSIDEPYYFYVKDASGNVTRSEAITPTKSVITTENMIATDGLQVSLNGNRNVIEGHDSTSEVWKNLSGTAYDATVKNGAVWRKDSIYFGKEKAFVDLGILNSDYQTMEVTFSYDTLYAANNHIMSSAESGGGMISVNKSGYIEGVYNINGTYQFLTSTIKAISGIRYTVALTYDGSVLNMYVNGKLTNTKSIAGKITAPGNNTTMILGGNPVSNEGPNMEYFNGNVYTARVYNRAITADEASDNYIADQINVNGSVKQSAISYTITFERPVTGITLDDFEVKNGTKQELNVISNSSYELVVEAPLTQGNQVRITIPEGICQDTGKRLNAKVTQNSTVNLSSSLTYTVTYNANGGTGAPKAQTKIDGISLKLSTTVPTRTGYTFKGWSTTSTGSATYVAGATYTANKSVTLYAVWQDSKSISSVSLVSGPTKTKYMPDEALNKTGIKLKVTYTSGTSETIKGESYVTSYTTDTNIASGIRHTLTIKYGGKTFTTKTYKAGWYGVEFGTYYYYTGNGVKSVGDQYIPILNRNQYKTYFHFQSDGKMFSGWRQDATGYRYYVKLGPETTNLHETISTQNWVDDYKNKGWERGSLVTDKWAQVYDAGRGKYFWYRLGTNGWMETGWIQLGGSWYWLRQAVDQFGSGPYGSMLADTSAYIGGKTYYFNSSGVCTNP